LQKYADPNLLYPRTADVGPKTVSLNNTVHGTTAFIRSLKCLLDGADDGPLIT